MQGTLRSGVPQVWGTRVVGWQTFQLGCIEARGQLPDMRVHGDSFRLVQSEQADAGCHLHTMTFQNTTRTMGKCVPCHYSLV